jgi:large subunit ribosomal protein L9
MAYQLLLIEDVDSLGRSGDIVKVKPGYARNYLLPKSKALVADANAIKMQERLQQERKKKALVDKQESEALAKELVDFVIETHVKVDQEGHMYGSVSIADICHFLKERKGVLLEKKSVLLKSPIKTLGVHEIQLKLKEGVLANFSLNILEDK